MGGGMLPVGVISSSPTLDFIARRIVAGFFMGAVAFIMTGFSIFVVTEKIMPLYKRIMKNYEDEALKAKKQLLEDVIEDEILK